MLFFFFYILHVVSLNNHKCVNICKFVDFMSTFYSRHLLLVYLLLSLHESEFPGVNLTCLPPLASVMPAPQTQGSSVLHTFRVN